MFSTISNKSNSNINSELFINEFVKPYQKKIDCAIFSAMPEELAFLAEAFSQNKYESIKIQNFEFKIYEYNNKLILLTHTGLGTAFAASVVTLVHQHFSPEFLLLSGTAGGINADLNLRDVILAEKAFEAEIQGVFQAVKNTPFESCLTHPLNNENFPPHYSANAELVQLVKQLDFPSIKIHTGTVVSSNAFPAPQELFEKIKGENPLSIDMETSAFYQIAWLLKAKALAIRGISNILNQDGTDDKLHESDIEGSARAAAQVVLTILDSLKYTDENVLEMKLETQSEIDQIIKRFDLQSHPEGGFYRRTFESTDKIQSVNPDRYQDENRNAGTSIYYLLNGNDFSAWHSLKSDEIWHFYKGSSVKIHVIDTAGKFTTHLLGDPLMDPNASFQVVIPAGNWFAAEIADKSSYSFVGCTVSPGFDFKDFVLADRELLTEQFPEHAFIIDRLTRDPVNDFHMSHYLKR